MTIDLDSIERTARLARERATELRKPWRRDGRTVWSGDWTKDVQQHPVVTYHVTDSNGRERFINEPPPIGTEATLDHIAQCSPDVVLSMVGQIRELKSTLNDALDHWLSLTHRAGINSVTEQAHVRMIAELRKLTK